MFQIPVNMLSGVGRGPFPVNIVLLFNLCLQFLLKILILN